MYDKHGYEDWYTFYPLEMFEDRMKDGQVYAVYDQELLIAAFTLEDIARYYYSVIRLDCAERKPWLCAFYKKAGYSLRGIASFAQENEKLSCFEKNIL